MSWVTGLITISLIKMFFSNDFVMRHNLTFVKTPEKKLFTVLTIFFLSFLLLYFSFFLFCLFLLFSCSFSLFSFIVPVHFSFYLTVFSFYFITLSFWFLLSLLLSSSLPHFLSLVLTFFRSVKTKEVIRFDLPFLIRTMLYKIL